MKNARKILLTTKHSPDLDTYLSVQVLAEVIKQDLGKDIDIAVNRDFPQNFTQAHPLPQVKVLTTLPPKKYLLQFKNQDNKIEGIQWNQVEGQINFYISMSKGKFNPQNMGFQVTGSDYDLVVLVGVEGLAELGELYSTATPIFDEARKLYLVKNPKSGGEARKTLSIAEQVFTYLDKNGIQINKDRATKLLAGMFAATDHFSKDITDPATYETAAKLVRKGARNQEAATIAKRAQESEQKPQAPAQPQPQPQKQAPQLNSAPNNAKTNAKPA